MDPGTTRSRTSAGSPAGEASISEPNLIDVALGLFLRDGGEPFLAAIDRNNEEVTVFHLGLVDGVPVSHRMERYPGFGTTPGGIAARASISTGTTTSW